MIRWDLVAAGAAVVVGAAFVTGASVPPRAFIGPGKPDEIPVKAAVLGQKTGYFNMAHVMRDYKRAKTSVARLNERRLRMVANLVGLKGMHADLQAELLAARLKGEQVGLMRKAEEINTQLVQLTRRIEDLDRECNRLLNNQATEIIVELYDEIHAAAAEMARENGLVALLTYPDAVTEAEMNNPMIKELKLKPPACQPFYLDPSVEYTGELLQRLNAKFAAEPGEK